MIHRDRIYTSRFLAGQVVRYHTWPTHSTQSIAEHCWRVAGILVEVFGLPRAEVLYYALHHDSGEIWAGDIPFTVKDNTLGLREASKRAEAQGLSNLKLKLPELTDLEHVQVKIADLLEMHEFGEHELTLGNLYAEPIMRDTAAEAQKVAAKHNLSRPVNHWLEERGSIL